MHSINFVHFPRIEEFLLPAGYNEDSATVAPPSWIVNEFQNDVPLHVRFPFITESGDSVRVEVIGTQEFKTQWKQEIAQAGAMVVERLSASTNQPRIDYILSDSEPVILFAKLAAARGLPLCSIDWAIQTIIQRKLQDPFEYPAYVINVEESVQN